MSELNIWFNSFNKIYRKKKKKKEKGMAENSVLFGSIHRRPAKVTRIFFSDLLKGREQVQISANVNLPFPRKYCTIQMRSQALESSGWVSAHGSLPSQALWPVQKTLKCKTWWEKSFDWRRSFTVKILYKTQILSRCNVLCLALSLPLMHEVKKHLQRPSLLMALHLREFTSSSTR